MPTPLHSADATSVPSIAAPGCAPLSTPLLETAGGSTPPHPWAAAEFGLASTAAAASATPEPQLAGVGALLWQGCRAAALRSVPPEALRARASAPVWIALLSITTVAAIDWATVGAYARISVWGLTATVAAEAMLAAAVLVGRRRTMIANDAGVIGALFAMNLPLQIAVLITSRLTGADRLTIDPGTASLGLQLIVMLAMLIWWTVATMKLGAGLVTERKGRHGLRLVVICLLASMLLPQRPIVDGEHVAEDSEGLLHYATDLMRRGKRTRRTPDEPPIDVEATYARQPRLVAQALARLEKSRPGRPEVYFVAAGSYAGQEVFRREASSARRIVDERLQTSGRSILLLNNRRTLEDLPLASTTNLDAVMDGLAGIMDADKDVLVLFVTSHGSEGLISISFPEFSLNDLTPARLSQALARSRVKNRVVILSACHSGSFMRALEDSHTLVLTAARADRTSFGCADENEWTYFGDALFNHGLRETTSFVAAFDIAKARIAAWEARDGITASEPQIALGDGIRAKLAEVETALRQADRAAPGRDSTAHTDAP